MTTIKWTDKRIRDEVFKALLNKHIGVKLSKHEKAVLYAWEMCKEKNK